MSEDEEGDEFAAGLSLRDAVTAHQATTGSLPTATLAPVVISTRCQHCGRGVGRCTGHAVSSSFSCGGWVHDDGRHVCYHSEHPKARQALPAPAPIPLGRSTGGRFTIVRAPEFRAESHHGRAHDLYAADWFMLWRQLVRPALLVSVFVGIMVWMDLIGAMK